MITPTPGPVSWACNGLQSSRDPVYYDVSISVHYVTLICLLLTFWVRSKSTLMPECNRGVRKSVRKTGYSCVVQRAKNVKKHISSVIYYVSYLDIIYIHISYHVSCVVCHVSSVMQHISHI